MGDGNVCFSLLLVKMFNAIPLSEDYFLEMMMLC